MSTTGWARSTGRDSVPGGGVIWTPDQRLRVFVSSTLRDVYRAYLGPSQAFVGIYWQSYGWVAPGEQISGLEDEYWLSAGLPRLIYVKSPAPERELGLTELLARIQDEGGVSYRHFSAAAELRQLVADDLAVLLSERFAAGPMARAAPRREGGRGPRPLPVAITSLVGREQAIGLRTRVDATMDASLQSILAYGRLSDQEKQNIGRAALGLYPRAAERLAQ